VFKQAHPVSVLLLVLLLFQAAGWTGAWLISRKMADVAAFEAMHASGADLQEQTLHAADLEKMRVGRREIRQNGRLFDIESVTIIGDSVRVRLWHDAREEKLYRLLYGFISADTSTKTPFSCVHWFAQWLTVVFILPDSTLLYFKKTDLLRQDILPYFFFLPNPPVTGVFDPPDFFGSLTIFVVSLF
jgi:hypothetical protein